MKRLLPFIVLILLVAGGILSIPFLLRPESHRAEITDKLSKVLKHPVVIGQLSMTYWPPTLRLEKVAAMTESGAPFLQMDSVSGLLDWSALFHLHFVPTDLAVTHAVLTTQRRPDGSWDIDSLFSGTSGLGTNAPPIARVTWKACEVHAMDAYASTPQELVVGGIDGNWDPKQGTLTTIGAFTGIGAPAHVSLNAKGQFIPSPQWSGDMQLIDGSRSGMVHVDQHGAVLDLKGSAAQWNLSSALAMAKFYGRGSATAADSSGALTLDNWRLHLHSDGQQLTVDHSAGISGGLSEMKGNVARRAADRVLQVDVALKDIPVEAVLSALGETIPLSGKVTGVAKDMEIVLSTQSMSLLAGQGYAELNEGSYKLPETSMAKLMKAKTMTYLKKKFPDLMEKGIPVTRAGAHWQAKDGIILVNDGFVVSTDMKAGWVGKLDAARQGLDGFIRLTIHEKNPQLSRLVPAHYHTQPAFGHLQGTWQEWTLRTVSVSKVPAATQSKLRKAVH